MTAEVLEQAERMLDSNEFAKDPWQAQGVISALLDEVERLREIVKPLADYYEHELKHLHPEPGEDPTTFDTAWINCFEHSCCIFRLAAAALGVK